jgi:hypothetical protein
MSRKLFAFGGVRGKPERRTKRPALVVLLWTAIGCLLLAGPFAAPAAYGASASGRALAAADATTTTAATATPATTAPVTTVATTAPTTVATTVATTVPATTATTSVTTTTEVSTTTTSTGATTSTTTRRVVVGIAATRGIVLTEKSPNAQSGWIAFGILLVVVLGLAVAWWVHERRRQTAAGSANKPDA